MTRTFPKAAAVALAAFTTTACSVTIEVDPQMEALKDIDIRSVSAAQLDKVKQELSSLDIGDPEQALRSFGDQHNIPINPGEVKAIKNAVCGSIPSDMTVGTLILNILGVPMNEDQLTRIIGATVTQFCPEKELLIEHS